MINSNESELENKRQRASVNEKFKKYSIVERNIVVVNSSYRRELQKDYFDTIRNLGIISGAISAFALPLLNNPKINYPILISSISLLLLNIIISFWHLLRIHSHNNKMLRDIENASLPPIRKIKESALDFIRNQKTFLEFLEEDEEFLKPGGKWDKIKDNLDLIKKENDNKLTHVEDFLVGVLIISILLFIYSIISSTFKNYLDFK